MMEEANIALVRAAGTFCKTRPEIHLFAARYDERHGRVDEARARYDHVLKDLAPRLLQAIVAAANFERRQVCFFYSGCCRLPYQSRQVFRCCLLARSLFRCSHVLPRAAAGGNAGQCSFLFGRSLLLTSHQPSISHEWYQEAWQAAFLATTKGSWLSRQRGVPPAFSIAVTCLPTRALCAQMPTCLHRPAAGRGFLPRLPPPPPAPNQPIVACFGRMVLRATFP